MFFLEYLVVQCYKTIYTKQQYITDTIEFFISTSSLLFFQIDTIQLNCQVMVMAVNTTSIIGPIANQQICTDKRENNNHLSYGPLHRICSNLSTEPFTECALIVLVQSNPVSVLTQKTVSRQKIDKSSSDNYVPCSCAFSLYWDYWVKYRSEFVTDSASCCSSPVDQTRISLAQVFER